MIGVHLRYFDSWLDFWNGKLEMLSKEYGSFEKVKEIFGGLDRSCILKRFREDLERARKLKARYVVFHVAMSVPGSCLPISAGTQTKK